MVIIRIRCTPKHPRIHGELRLHSPGTKLELQFLNVIIDVVVGIVPIIGDL